MKGLLIKDLKLMKNNSGFFIMIVLISIACSAIMKNPVFAMGYATALISIFSVNTIAYDEYDNGMAHLFSLPISRKMYVKEKYLFAVLITIVGLGIATIIGVGVAVFTKDNYTVKDWAGILALSVFFMLMVQTVILPVRMKFDSEKHKMAMVIAFGVLFLIMGALFGIAEAMGIDVEAIFDGILLAKAWVTLAFIVIVGIVMMMISYRISVSFLQKREF